MSFVFDITKVVQASAYLAKKSPQHSINVLALLKLLYIADREALRETGLPITGDNYVAMKYGPVLSKVYDLTKTTADWPCKSTEEESWCEHFERTGYNLRLVSDPGADDLSPAEIEILDRVFLRYGDFDRFDLVALTHEFPEWRNNEAGASSAPIPLRDVLDAVGRTASIESITRLAEEDRNIAHTLGL